MKNYVQAKDYELWMLIKNGLLIPTKLIEDGTEDFKKMEKNAKAKQLLYFGPGPDEYARISECESAKTYGMPFK